MEPDREIPAEAAVHGDAGSAGKVCVGKEKNFIIAIGGKGWIDRWRNEGDRRRQDRIESGRYYRQFATPRPL